MLEVHIAGKAISRLRNRGEQSSLTRREVKTRTESVRVVLHLLPKPLIGNESIENALEIHLVLLVRFHLKTPWAGEANGETR